MQLKDQSTSVLVVGGGPTGATAALLLALRNIPTIMIERHGSESLHPKAIGFTTRTMEIYRAAGLGDDIPQIPPGMGRPRRITVDSMAGEWHDELFWSEDHASATDDPDAAIKRALKASPCTGAGMAQDRLEPILRDKAAEHGADIRMRTELISFSQDESGITAVLRPRDGGDEYTVRAQYMIAADGHASPVREGLGIGRSGNGFLSTVRSVLFRADLDKYLEAGISQFDITQPDFQARLVTYRDGRWALMFEDDEERDEETLRKLVIRAIGEPDIDVELITTGRWELSALIADRFSKGRIFIVGDAAHTFPPARGGFGANTGIEDSHNLVWKIDAVLTGKSDPSLLETYDAERRAIAWLRHGQIFNSDDYAKFAKPGDKLVPKIEDEGMELGQLYRSEAVLNAGADLPPAQSPEKWAGQPGTRAPHLWVWEDGNRLSTLDLVRPNCTVFTADERWAAAAADAAKTLGIPVSCAIIGQESAGPAAGDARELSLDTPVGQIAASPAGEALLEKHIPEIAGHPDYERFKSMSLLKLQPLAPKQITDERLVKIEADLADLQAPSATTMSLDTPIEQIVNNVIGKAALEEHLPQVIGHSDYQKFKAMTLKQLQPMAPKELPDDKLAKIGAALCVIPSTGGPSQTYDPEAVRAEFCKVFGLTPTGASLVRPDGYVAWRSVDMPADMSGCLSEAIAQIMALARG